MVAAAEPRPRKPAAVARAERRLADTEERLRQSRDAEGAAQKRLAQIDARQVELATAVIGEDPAAVAENAHLEDELVVQDRRATTARRAAAGLEAEVAEAREALAEANRGTHREAYERMARKRRDLEEQAEASITALAATLAELRELDGRQRQAAREGGKAAPNYPLPEILAGWLGARLGGYRGFLPLGGPDHMRGRKLADIDPLAGKGR